MRRSPHKGCWPRRWAPRYAGWPGRLARVFGRAALAGFAAALALCSPALAQRDLKEIPPADPELERKALEVAEGFEINLFASDPQIVKPIQMNFDAAGRLWVVCSELYPHILPGQEPTDRVVVLEDADGDGVAERSTVFAEGLLIPTGIEPGDGGAYVGNSTELVFLQDADGDGRADQSRVVLSGFGTEDTHHILHTLRWGYDGQLYFNQSIYIHSHVETPWGVRRLGGGGTWMFRPEAMRLEVFTRGLVNPWGHHFDRWGQSFGTDGAGGEGINYLFPGSVMFTAPGARRIVAGLNPGSPKHCGLEVVSGRHLPDDWQGNLITNDFRAHRVCRFVVRDNGSGFSSHEQPELVKTTHVAFRPVDVKQGPDGAIYIADWYNPIIQHGEVDFRDPRRDHAHGRIWRITAKGRPLVPRPRLTDAPTADLLEALKAPEDWTRHFAKRVLKERGPEVLDPLGGWTAALNPADPELDHRRLEALWVFQGLDAPQPALLEQLLAAADPRPRAAAVRVASRWADRLPRIREYLATAAADPHPRVRLEAVRALALLGEPRSIEVALRALDQPLDRFLDFALWQTARDLQSQWLPALESGEIDFGGDSNKLLFALEAVESPRALTPLVRAVETGRIAESQQQRALTLVAQIGGADELGRVLRLVVAAEPPSGLDRAALLEALTAAAAARRLVPTGDLAPLAGLLSADSPQLQTAAARAAGQWKVEAARAGLAALAGRDSPAALRLAAIDALAAWRDDAALAALEALAARDEPPALRRAAAAALASCDVARGARLAPDVLAAEPEGDPEATSGLFAALLGQKEGPRRLATALDGRQLPRDVAKIGLRLAQVGDRTEPSLVAALRAAGGISDQPRVVSADELSRLVRLVAEQGDALRGEQVYRRHDLACQKCHAIAGAGGRVGPDLVSIGASAQIDYLLDSILAPNKQVKENYHATVVATGDGRIASGIVLRETDDELVLLDGEDQERSIAKADIEERQPGGSLMPAGLADQLTESELTDLVRFLSELGKVGPLAVGPERLVRRWERLDGSVEETAKLVKRRGLEAALRQADQLAWVPIYTLVNGELPPAECTPLALERGDPPVAVLRTSLAVPGGGARLTFNEPAGLQVWVDARPVDLELASLELDEGLHELTCAVDPARRQAGLRLRIDERALATAQNRDGAE